MGLALAKEIRGSEPMSSISIIEKEESPAFHASGRNSGVLHAGFYYTGDSLKARFTRDGNRFWRDYCQEKNLPMNPCGKVVVARNENEASGILELKKRGDQNGVNVTVIDKKSFSRSNPMPEHIISPFGLRIRHRSIQLPFAGLLKKSSSLPVYSFLTGLLTRKDLDNTLS